MIYHHREKTVKSIAIEDKMQLDFCKKNKKDGRPKTTDTCSKKPSEKFNILTCKINKEPLLMFWGVR